MSDFKELRKYKAISQRDLAKISGVSLNTICRLEQGKQMPNWQTIRKLAKALGVQPNIIEFPGK